ncbi:hypothetical protein [Streptomyces sp. WL006]|uniref:hypothetical protein n=1 Tax=Streptomyces sp. WL006 TaxID=3423915 RepID=UPI003F6AF859
MVSTPARDTTPDAARDPDGRPYADGFRPATLDWDGWTCADCIVCATGRQCADCRACTNFALPYPPHWVQAWTEGHPERGIEAFGGPGGMSAGRALVDDSGDWVLIEFNRDAAATARAAGHWVVEADIRTLDPRHPVLRHVRHFHGSPPCQTLSGAGRRSGWSTGEIAELQSVMWQASEAFGFLEVDDLCSLYGGPHSHVGDVLDGMEDHPDADGVGDLCHGGHLPPTMTPDEFREWAASTVSDDRTALMAEMLIWPMCLIQIGAPLVSITMEQSANILKQSPALAEAIQSEITSVEGFGWAWCSWQIADAADYGAATHRVRAWMVATRYAEPRYAEHVDGDQAARQMWAHVLKRTGRLPDWTPELNRRIDPYQGRPAPPCRRSPSRPPWTCPRTGGPTPGASAASTPPPANRRAAEASRSPLSDRASPHPGTPSSSAPPTSPRARAPTPSPPPTSAPWSASPGTSSGCTSRPARTPGACGTSRR